MNLIGAFLIKLWSTQAFSSYFHKMAAIFVFRNSPKSIGFFHFRSSMAVSNMNLIHALVSQLCETQALAYLCFSVTDRGLCECGGNMCRVLHLQSELSM